MTKITRDDIWGAVARAWCRPETEKMEMNPTLAEIITDEIILLLDDRGIQIKR